MILNYMTFKQAGPIGIIEDYKRYVCSESASPTDENEKCCILEDITYNDLYWEQSLKAFLDMAINSGISVIEIDITSLREQLTLKDFDKFFEEFGNYIDNTYGDMYVNLDSYRDSFCLGLDVYYRGKR